MQVSYLSRSKLQEFVIKIRRFGAHTGSLSVSIVNKHISPKTVVFIITYTLPPILSEQV